MKAVKKLEPEKIVEAEKHGQRWKLTHKDGRVTWITDHKFEKRYNLEEN